MDNQKKQEKEEKGEVLERVNREWLDSHGFSPLKEVRRRIEDFERGEQTLDVLDRSKWMPLEEVRKQVIAAISEEYNRIHASDDDDNMIDKPSSLLSVLSKEEIKKLEVDYRLNTVVSIGCPLSMYMSKKYIESNPYELIFVPYHKNHFIKERLVKTIDADTLKRILYKYSDNSVCMSTMLEWLLDIYISADNAKEQMLDYFPLREEQIEIEERYDGIKYIFVTIPDIEKNVELIKKALGKFGYFCSTPVEEMNSMDDDNVMWFRLQFEPHHQEIITKLSEKAGVIII